MAKRLADIASPTLARSPTGGQGLVLDEKGRVRLDLLDVPRVRVYYNGSATVGTGAWTSLAMDSERYDPWGMHDTATNNSRITITRAGIYHVGGTVMFDAGVAGYRWLRLLLNGTGELGAHGGHVAASQPRYTIGCDWEFAENDYVELQAYQDSGGNISLGYSEFWCHWVGAASGKVY